MPVSAQDQVRTLGVGHARHYPVREQTSFSQVERYLPC